jgi:hypothetical protein
MTRLSELYDLMSKFEPYQDRAERHRQEQLLTDCISAENADAFGRALGQCKSPFVPDHVGGIFSNNGADLLLEASQAYEEGDDAQKMKGVISYVTSSLALERHLHAIDQDDLFYNVCKSQYQ